MDEKKKALLNIAVMLGFLGFERDAQRAAFSPDGKDPKYGDEAVNNFIDTLEKFGFKVVLKDGENYSEEVPVVEPAEGEKVH